MTQLERPWPARLVLVTALLLVSPTLWSGLIFDDYLLAYKTSDAARDDWGGSAPFDLFRWIDDTHLPRLLDGQGLPWWNVDRTVIAFMRPVSSLTHALDHGLWPHSAFGMHLQSLFWFACMLLVAARTYAELCEDRFIAAVASAMFALDSAHATAVGWISNRNALVGGVFGIATLLFHHRRRGGAGRLALIMALGCFALGLLSVEGAIGSAGYLAAYALYLERGTLRRRLAALLPYAAISGVWFAARRALHYGVVGLPGYVDPIREPLVFLRELPQRLPLLLACQIARLSAEFFGWAPPALQAPLLVAALVCCALALWVAWPSLRSDRHVRFWACGALLSTVPLTAAVPSDRLLTLVGLGVMPALARLLHDALQPAAERSPALGRWPELARRNVVLALGFVHLVVDPLFLPAVAWVPWFIGGPPRAAEASLSTDPTLREHTVIVAQIPDSFFLGYLPAMRSVNGKPRPQRLHWLLATPEQARFERLGPKELRVTCAQGFFDGHWFEKRNYPLLHRGTRVQLTEMTATIVEVTDDGRPAVCDFSFAQPLESSKYVWLTWRAGRLEPFRVPSLNGSGPR